MKVTEKRKIYWLREASEKIGRPAITLRRWWNSGKFPKPSLVNSRLCWPSEIIDEWINTNTGGARE